MIDRMKRSRFRTFFAILLIVYGVVALVTPGLPGAWFVLIGLEFFGIKLLWGEKIKAAWNTWRNKRSQISSPQEETPKEPPL